MLLRDSPSPILHSFGRPEDNSEKVVQQAQCEVALNRRLDHHEADVVIVGAGILGSAAAIAFGQQGRSVILLERSLKEPDRIVGELLQPGGVFALERLGIRDCLEEIDAIPVRGYDVIYYGTPVLIPYPANASPPSTNSKYTNQVQSNGSIANGHVNGFPSKKDSRSEAVSSNSSNRPEGRSFHHGRFIRRLRERAKETPNVTIIETTVTELVKCGYSGQVLGVECSTNGEQDFYFGHQTLVCDGYASKFRSSYIRHAPKSKSKFYGLELRSPAPSAPPEEKILPQPYHGHVVLGASAPILLYQIGTHETRALIDVPENTPTATPSAGGVKGHLRSVVLPSLPKSVQPAFEEALDEGKLRSMPNSFLPPSTNITPGLLILGDAMNMRHPLTGGGMTVALNDVVLLSELLSPQHIPSLADTHAVLRAMRTFHWRRKNLTSVINILAQALYSLFAANDPQLRALQLGCFRYFQLGGNCVDGPVGLLAGIITQPLVLVYHFYSVAVLSMWIYITEAGSVLGIPLRIFGSLGVLWKACVVIMPYIFTELRP